MRIKKSPARIASAGVTLAPRGFQGDMPTSHIPEHSRVSLPAARGNGSHQRLVDLKEHGFTVATLGRPLTSRTAILLKFEQGELRLSRRFALFATELQEFFPGDKALALYYGIKRRRHLTPQPERGAVPPRNLYHALTGERSRE